MNLFIKFPGLVLLILSNLLPGSPLEYDESLSILESHHKVTLHEDFSYTEEISRSILIHSPEALRHGHIEFITNSFTKLVDFEAKVTHSLNGKTLANIKRKQLMERSLLPEGTLYGDSKLAYYYPNIQQFPVKIEYRIKKKVNGNFHLPHWRPYQHYKQEVKMSTYEVVYPKKQGLRFKEVEIDRPHQTREMDGNIYLSWQIEDLPPIQESGEEEVLPEIMLAPVFFAMQGFEGNMDSWESFGLWLNELNRGKEILSEDNKALVHELLQGVDDPVEKIERLYHYVQTNFRYVSIQLGLGGWMPQPAQSVMHSKFGDCKGLTMLMKAMLNEAGVPSDYTLVKSGDNAKPIDLSFPSNQFNHAILRVPLEKDTIWIECTSSTLPAGFLGTSTMNRHVLVVTEDGGQIDRTPSYSQSGFHQVDQFLQIELLEHGNAKIDGLNQFQGFPASTLIFIHQNLTEKDLKTFLNKYSGGAGLVIQDYKIDAKRQIKNQSATIDYSGHVQQFYQSTSKRIVLPLSWSKWMLDDVESGAALFKESTSIKLNQSLSWDGSPPSISLVEDYYTLEVKTFLSGEELHLDKSLELRFPEDFSERDKSSVIYDIQEKLNQQLYFIKN